MMRWSRAQRGLAAITVAGLAAVALVPASWWGPSVTIVDVVLPDWNYDSDVHPEPTIAVNPTDPKTIALSATYLGYAWPTPPPGFCPSDAAGILLSFDEGSSWSLRCPLQRSQLGSVTDVAIDFTGDGSALIASYLDSPNAGGRVQRVRDWTVYETTTSEMVKENATGADQPFAVASPNPTSQAFTVGTYMPTPDCPAGGIIWWWNTKKRNGAPCVAPRPAVRVMTVRTAHARDGRSYGLYLSLRNDDKSDLVLVRGRLSDEDTDDAARFDDLTDDVLLDPFISSSDPCAVHDGALGQRLRNCAYVPTDSWHAVDNCLPGLGPQRRNPNQIALAIDPSDSRTVYFVYGDAHATPDDSITLHLARWSDASGQREVRELLTVRNALNPAIVITDAGRIGFAYQQFIDGNWQTHIQVSSPDKTVWDDIALTDPSPEAEPACHPTWSSPYLGDYMDIAAVGETIYGTFSFNNNPVRNPDAIYLRDKTLLGSSAVPYTIDPFFYKVTLERPLYAAAGAYMKMLSTRAAEVIKSLVRMRFPFRPPRDTTPPLSNPRTNKR